MEPVVALFGVFNVSLVFFLWCLLLLHDTLVIHCWVLAGRYPCSVRYTSFGTVDTVRYPSNESLLL
jgi:hypothetical protein